MKANDNIPKDEMLLAEAIAAARASDLTWVSGQRFWPFGSTSTSARACCAMGALEIAGILQPAPKPVPRQLVLVWVGNDEPAEFGWEVGDDLGETLGWAFRCAMESQ